MSNQSGQLPNDLSPEAHILLQRYDQLCRELHLRFEARYKILQLVFTVVIAIFGIWLTGEEFRKVAYAGCPFLLATGFLLFADNKGIQGIVRYLLRIEQTLDTTYRISVPGWERHLLGARTAKPIWQTIRTLAYVLLFIALYSAFNFMGWRASGYDLIVLILVELPVAIALIIMYFTERDFYK